MPVLTDPYANTERPKPPTAPVPDGFYPQTFAIEEVTPSQTALRSAVAAFPSDRLVYGQAGCYGGFQQIRNSGQETQVIFKMDPTCDK